MKKILTIIFLGLGGIFSLKAQSAFKVELSYGRTPCGNGGGPCKIESRSNLQERSIDNTLSPSVFLDEMNRANFKIPKSSIKSEITLKEFEGKYMLYLEDDLPLDLDTENDNRFTKPLILAHGWHPIIELEDCYIISYTLKQ
jgi:hypothetical protein